MSTRARILEVAARLVAESPNGDVSTRAVCDAAQVGAPALYRHFGDKEGLLSAVVDHGFDKYLETKRERTPQDDPIEDLRKGWDNHVEFALDNPNLYRLMYSPAMRTPPAAALESHEMLTRDLRRAAADGKLSLAPEAAAQVVMSANVGVALMLVARPSTFTDRDTSRRVRDAVHATVFTSEALAERADRPAKRTQLPAAAAQLNVLLGRSGESGLSTAEMALMTEWLRRLSTTSATSAGSTTSAGSMTSTTSAVAEGDE
ncbi:TetR/AcrR family transcriptional regulator [Streptomyces sp. NBC_01716]|uniref:TetR/AcrR family transcriptional regulator n=1 Tax=Streptomyces sp. NBC_01716 TaxID=2975917 RepID=UPI002E32156C|nr:TetR/AcrR family transcriptional regulator [Streptomyces sp. NBC_01716]